MSKRMFVGVMVAALAVVLAGGALASNMGFKLNYTLIAGTQTTPETAIGGDGLSQDGQNDVSLPDFGPPGLLTARDLITDINTSTPANQAGAVSKFLRDNDTFCTYTGVKGTPCTSNFALLPGESYRVRVLGTVNVPYLVVGSHNPALSHVFIATSQPTPETAIGGDGFSQDGQNSYNFPYHSTAVTAKDLISEIGTAATSVSKFLRDNDTFCTYTGVKGTPCTSNFTLVPGENYRVRVLGTSNVSIIPNHF